MNPTVKQRESRERVEDSWVAAIDAGITVRELAALYQVDRKTLYRRIKAARSRIAAARSLSGPSAESPLSESSEIPTLELCEAPNPSDCSHGTTSTNSEGLRYCLRCDAISTDGGRHWLAAQDPHTPSLAVLAPDRHGRRHRLQRLTAGSQAEPGGPTSHRPDPSGLAGGTGSPTGRSS